MLKRMPSRPERLHSQTGTWGVLSPGHTCRERGDTSVGSRLCPQTEACGWQVSTSSHLLLHLCPVPAQVAHRAPPPPGLDAAVAQLLPIVELPWGRSARQEEAEQSLRETAPGHQAAEQKPCRTAAVPRAQLCRARHEQSDARHRLWLGYYWRYFCHHPTVFKWTVMIKICKIFLWSYAFFHWINKGEFFPKSSVGIIMTESLSNEVGLTCVQVMFPELNCSRGAAGQSKSSWTLDDQAHRVTVAAGWVPGAKGAGTSPADACCSLRRAAGLCWHSRAVLGWSSCRSRC